MKAWLLLFIGTIFLVFSSVSVVAVCTVAFDKSVYSPGETVEASMGCDAANEKSNAYTLTWTNGTATAETDVGTTPSIVGQTFTETFLFPSGSAVPQSVNATLTGSNLEGSANATIQVAGSNQLIIIDIKARGTFLGLSSSLDIDVTDENDKKINGGSCSIAVKDPTNDENLVEINNLPMTDGDMDATWILDYQRFREAKDYVTEVECICGSNVTALHCWDEDGVDVINSVGTTDVPFTTSTWLVFNQNPLVLSTEAGDSLATDEVNLTAGFDHVHWIENITNNNPLGEPMEANIFTLLINNETGTSIGIVNEGNTQKTLRGFPAGNSTSVRNHLLAKDAPDGIYFVLTKIDLIYKGQFQVAQYILLTDFFNITSLNTSLQILGTEVHDFFDVEVNTSSSTQSLTSLPISNNTDPFILLTEGFESDFCMNVTNNNEDDVVLFLDHLRLENPTLGTNQVLIDEATSLKSSVDGNTNEEPCFTVTMPLNLDTHSDYRLAFEAHVGTVDGPFVCGEDCIFEGHTPFFWVAAIEDMISIPKFIREPNATDLGRPGVFLMNGQGKEQHHLRCY